MTKVDIVSSVYEKVGFSKKEAVRVVETIFDIVKEALASLEERSEPIGFYPPPGGIFETRGGRERTWSVNPRQTLL